VSADSREQVFDRLFRDQGDAVLRYCAWFAGPGAAEDLASATFLAAYADYPRSRPDPGMLRPWLFRIARNMALNHQRSQHRWMRALQRLINEPQPVSDVEKQVLRNADLAAALNVVAGLRTADRMLIALRIGGGLSFAEVAEVAGISETAARSAVSRALARSRAQLEQG
jgi:RNA polymerase sigma factor (sigma-70 family)